MAKGVAIYEIEEGRLVSGSFALDNGNGHWLPEIVIKDDPNISGNYLSTYFNDSSTAIIADLFVGQEDSSTNVYQLQWIITHPRPSSSTPTFKGVGFLNGSNQMVVNYWDV